VSLLSLLDLGVTSTSICAGRNRHQESGSSRTASRGHPSAPARRRSSATGDNLVNEARLLAERGTAAGVAVRLELYPVSTHDFHLFWTFLPEAADALHRVGEFLGGAGDLATAAGE
jgi:acetyl esterase/lipase